MSPPNNLPQRVIIASRESALALWQARHVEHRLREHWPRLEVRILGLTTEGDRRLEVSLARVGGKGLFVKELEEALADGRADLAVHSMKDVPMALPPGMTLAAIPDRADPHDAFVSNRWREPAALPPGARVGTASLRRAALLRARYPHLVVEPVRGNVPTRLRRLDEGGFDALVLAAAGLKRLGLEARITRILPPAESLPAPGQGALGIECLAQRADLLALLAPLDHAPTRCCVGAERAFSRALSGSCNVPLGAFAQLEGERLRLRGFVGTPDGARTLEGEETGRAEDAEAIGHALAARLKAQGAGDILRLAEGADG